MNEVSNCCTRKCKIPKGKQCPTGTRPGWICCLDCKNITKTRWDDPPYKINASGIQAPIGYKTIATSVIHYNGSLEYDAHSLYGFSETIATHKGLQGLEGKRPFILSRSTYVGSGKYVAHWTGDNKGTWEDLKYSISTMLNFGLFGVPMVGSDICGFYPQPTEELCNCWIEVGVFYPFSRDHANYYSPRQELYQWKSVAKSARNALGMRYKLFPYFYTLNYEAHVSGAPITRPFFFSFPTYTECYGLSTQFLIGSSVMVSPVLEQGKTKVKALFPPGLWYNLFNTTQAIVSQGQYVTLDASLHVVNIHLYQNTILPMQQGGMLTKEARQTPFHLIVAFPPGSSSGKAHGNLFINDDEYLEMKLGNGYSSYIDFYATLSKGIVKVWSQVKEGKFALGENLIIEKVSVLGLGGGATSALEIDGNPMISGSSIELSSVAHNYLKEMKDSEGKSQSVVVEIKGLSLLIGNNFTITWNMGISG